MWPFSRRKSHCHNKAGYTEQDAPSMRFFTIENNMGRTYGPTDRRTDGRTTSYRDATAHLKSNSTMSDDEVVASYVPPRYLFMLLREEDEEGNKEGRGKLDAGKRWFNGKVTGAISRSQISLFSFFKCE